MQYQSFLAIAKFQISDPTFLNVISYHDTNGKVASDAAVASTGALKAINSRPDGLVFAKLRCGLDFTDVKRKIYEHLPFLLIAL